MQIELRVKAHWITGWVPLSKERKKWFFSSKDNASEIYKWLGDLITDYSFPEAKINQKTELFSPGMSGNVVAFGICS